MMREVVNLIGMETSILFSGKIRNIVLDLGLWDKGPVCTLLYSDVAKVIEHINDYDLDPFDAEVIGKIMLWWGLKNPDCYLTFE
jgi:hypothetical protein